MQILHSSVRRWLRRGTAFLVLSTAVLAGCGGDDSPEVVPVTDGGSDAKGTSDSSPDTANDRGTVPETGADVDASLDRSVDGPDETAPADGQNDSRPDVDAAANDSPSDAPAEAPQPSCTDHAKNGSETDVDCGGSCAPASTCAEGRGCSTGSDCQSGVCNAQKVCAAPACTDQVKNGSETDVDCGGSCAPNARCVNGKTCSMNGDCQSGICKDNVCIAAGCTNLVKDSNETGIDCGGLDCGPCNDGVTCSLNRDCKSGKCTDLVCTAPSCTDGVKNGSETDVDCGGSCSTKCALAKTCSGDGDCQSGHCPAGTCVECVTPSTCPGEDTECQSRTCNSNVCAITYAVTGTPVAAQTTGDCQSRVCNGTGGITSVANDADTPVDDNQCTSDICSSGVPSHPALSGSTCDQSGGQVCSNSNDGTCVACNQPSECPGQDTECQSRTCIAHVCGFNYTVDNSLTSAQTPGDCHKNVCDGSGNIVTRADNTDVPADDGNVCTAEVCTNGAPQHVGAANLKGAVCTAAQGGRCDDVGNCVATFMVVRIGTGSGTLSSSATAVFVERRYFNPAGALVPSGTISLPVVANGDQQPLTMSGTAKSEGALSLSADGRFVTLAGYAAVGGTTSVKSTTTALTNRIVGRIDAAGVVDTRTRLTSAFDQDNVRGATSVDGSSFWVTGSSSGLNAGIQWITLGTSGGTQ